MALVLASMHHSRKYPAAIGVHTAVGEVLGVDGPGVHLSVGGCRCSGWSIHRGGGKYRWDPAWK